MADPVEIQNVGGLRGVASEVTLLELRDAMRDFSRSGSSNNRSNTSTRLQDLYNRSLRESTNSNWLASKANAALDTKTGRLITSFAKGATTLSDFSSAVFGTESSLTKLANYIDSNISTWRELSSVGASFNNSLFDMISSAANSGMELDDYSKMIMRNSEQLARFGGTVTNGAKFVGEFSKTFRRDLGSRFFEMGFTIEDINESLIGFMSLESRRSANGLRDDRKTQASAANYILQLDKLAKLTGEERKQLADRISQQQTDAGIAARINSLQGAQQENLQSAIAFFDSQLPGVSDGFKDLMDGVAQTDLGKALETAIPGIGQYMQQVFTGEEDINEVLSALQDRFGPALSNFSSGFSKAQIDQMRMQGGVTGALAELMDSLYQFNQVSQLSAEEMAEEQNRRNAVTSAFAKFEQAVIDLRRMFVDMFYDVAMSEGGLFDAFEELGNVISDLFGTGTKSVGKIGTATSSMLSTLINNMFGSSGIFTRAIKSFTNWIQSEDYKNFVNEVNESFTAVSTWMSEFANDIRDKGFWNTFKEQLSDLGSWIKELFMGKTVTEMTPAGPKEVQKDGLIDQVYKYIFGDKTTSTGQSLIDKLINFIGLDSESNESLLSQMYNNMSESFTNFWEGPYGKSMADTIINYFGKLIDQITAKFTGSGEEASSSIGTGEGMGTSLGSQAVYSLTGGYFGGGNREGALSSDAFLEQAENWFADRGSYSLLGESREEIESTAKSWIQDTLDHLMSPEGGSLSKSMAKDQIKSGLIEFMSTPGRYTGEDFETMQKYMSDVVIPRLDSFANGTNGFQNFGSGTMAMLHNSEAVVPRNTPAGDLLQSFYDFQNKKVAAVTSTPMASDSQSSLIKKVEELNTTMIKVAELLQSSVGLQEKTVKGVKGLGSDFYRGISR